MWIKDESGNFINLNTGSKICVIFFSSEGYHGSKGKKWYEINLEINCDSFTLFTYETKDLAKFKMEELERILNIDNDKLRAV